MSLFPRLIVLLGLLGSTTLTLATTLPPSITPLLPKGFVVFTFLAGDLNNDKKPDYLVVAHNADEEQIAKQTETAPRRPLLVFIQNTDGSYRLAARNDAVVYAINEGGQCDPFMDGEDGLAIKGAYFTVQNGVACGQHWTDFITFKYSPTLNNWVFHKRIFENWIMNPSTKADAEALILDSHKVISGKRDQPVLFQNYQPH